MEQLPSHIILYDGDCGFCNRAVQFVLKRDRKRLFHFSALKASTGKALLQKAPFDPEKIDSVVFIKEGRFYSHSDAALEIASALGGGWRVARVLYLVPKAIRDGLYKWIAKNRYRLMKRSSICTMPNAEERGRFLEQNTEDLV